MTKSTRKEILNIITIFLVIFISVSPLLPTSIFALFLFLIIALNLKYLKTFKLNKKLGILIIILWYLILNGVLDLRNYDQFFSPNNLNLYFPLCFITGYLLSERFTYEKYLSYLDKIVFFGAIFSLIGMLIINFYPTLVSSLPNYTYGGFTHKTGIFFNVLYADGMIVNRNTGFAREPGVFQLLLNIGVLATIRDKSKNQTLKLIIYGLSLYLTKSTAGLIIFSFLLIKMIIEIPTIKYLLLVIIPFFLNEIYSTIVYQTENKLVGSSSFASRMEPTKNAFRIGIFNFFGLGNTGYDKLLNTYNIGAWDSFGQIFIRYGIVMLALFLYLLYKISKMDFGMFLIIFFTSISQGTWFIVLLTPIYFMAFNREKL